MPQFELAFYLSQAFWMLISFGFLYLLVDNVLLPMIYDVFDERKRLIAENLAAAEKANKEAEIMMKNYQHYLLTAEQEAADLLKKAYQDINAITHKIELQHDRKLKAKIKKAEIELKQRADNTDKKTASVADALAHDLVNKLKETPSLPVSKRRKK